jgi:tRNA (mo5U34)-methyltransferase
MHKTTWQSAFFASILNTSLERYLADFALMLKNWESNIPRKELRRWQKQLAQLPDMEQVSLHVDKHVALQSNVSLSATEIAKTQAILKNFMPWRKGPFDFFSIDIDTEWRSDWKWDRVVPHIKSLSNRRVLDVGCGSGYHLFRMFEAGASQVIGIDPTPLFFFQFHCFKRYLEKLNVHYLPVGIEALPATNYFDTVFSMGVLYHRHDPIKFLRELKNQMQIGGQLVLETLVVDGDENTVLMPKDRYAQMRNVWYLPSIDALTIWMQRAGFRDIKCVDVDITSTEEQRATQWMQNHSLVDFLDSHNNRLTIEGYPAPKRAVMIASI